MPIYQSELSIFLQQLLDAAPALKELQQNNRATWWDRPQDIDAQRAYQESAVPQAPYAYFPLPATSAKSDA